MDLALSNRFILITWFSNPFFVSYVLNISTHETMTKLVIVIASIPSHDLQQVQNLLKTGFKVKLWSLASVKKGIGV